MGNKNRKVIANSSNKKTEKKSSNKVLIYSISAIVVVVVAIIIAVVLMNGEDEKSADVEFGKTKIPDTICQYSSPEKGEIVALMYIKDYGVIKMKFFETIAPKAVENFVKHAKEGYYNGVLFHRVMDDFMIQGGDPTGTGRGGESIWGVDFDDEISTHLAPVRGALCMANTGAASSNSSQFFIVQTKEHQDEYVEILNQYNVDKDIVEYYEKNGGTGWLYGKHTVFGQVYEGMDVVDKIAATSTDANNRPLTDVVIEKIVIKEYE